MGAFRNGSRLSRLAANLALEVGHKARRSKPSVHINSRKIIERVADCPGVRLGVCHPNLQPIAAHLHMLGYIENIRLHTGDGNVQLQQAAATEHGQTGNFGKPHCDCLHGV